MKAAVHTMSAHTSESLLITRLSDGFCLVRWSRADIAALHATAVLHKAWHSSSVICVVTRLNWSKRSTPKKSIDVNGQSSKQKVGRTIDIICRRDDNLLKTLYSLFLAYLSWQLGEKISDSLSPLSPFLFLIPAAPLIAMSTECVYVYRGNLESLRDCKNIQCNNWYPIKNINIKIPISILTKRIQYDVCSMIKK